MLKVFEKMAGLGLQSERLSELVGEIQGCSQKSRSTHSAAGALPITFKNRWRYAVSRRLS
jgi:hypothetical protein